MPTSLTSLSPLAQAVAKQIDASWVEPLHHMLHSPQFEQLAQFVALERQQHEVFPPNGQVFTALQHTPLHQVRAVILGQDPYHGAGQAQGLCFSVSPQVPIPPSLRNIFIELHNDLSVPPPKSGSLLEWAKQGVLLLNTVLTVRAGTAGSHQGRGWEQFSHEVLRAVWQGPQPVAFILWGRWASQTLAPITKLTCAHQHLLLRSPHPSPLSAYSGFFGSKPFSQVNTWLQSIGHTAIDWSLNK